tara:strand:- start:1641 stop:2843 length:1203 start_codon:yes stop_codon:yes gene_type:complete
MATILKIPDINSKGIVVFTDKERDSVLLKRKKQIKLLKSKWIIGLHHNYFYSNFKYNPLYDFSIATKDDLKEINNTKFPMFEASVVNFNRDNFWKFNKREKHWDVLNISKNVDYKKNETFIKVVRELYNMGLKLRVLMISYKKPDKIFKKRSLNNFYLESFNESERQLFNLIELETPSPPYDFETLSFFYSKSKVFCSTSEMEHRPRVPSYAISSGIPIVVSKSISTLFPEELRREPGVFIAQTIFDFPNQIIKALNYVNSPVYSKKNMQPFIDCFSNKKNIYKLKRFLSNNFNLKLENSKDINFKNLDIRLARHIGFEHNLIGSVPINMDSFLDFLIRSDSKELLKIIKFEDLERNLLSMETISSSNLYYGKPILNLIKEFLINYKLDKYPRKILKYFN